MSNLQSIVSNPPGSSVHEILQAGILEWVAISFSSEDVRFYTVKLYVEACLFSVLQHGSFLLKLFSCLLAVFYALNSIKTNSWEIPDSPVVRTSDFHSRGLRFHP